MRFPTDMEKALTIYGSVNKMHSNYRLLAIAAAVAAMIGATEAVQAKLVYVSATVPNNSQQDGTSTVRAYKSIAQVNAASSSGGIVAGDTVLFRCGVVWPPVGQAPVPLIAKAGVIYSTYSTYNTLNGSGERVCDSAESKPIFMGSTELNVLTPTANTAWQVDNTFPGVTGVYSLQLANTVADITQLTDGASEIRYTRARYPNSGSGQYGAGSNYNKLAPLPGVTPATSLVPNAAQQTYIQALLGDVYTQTQALVGATAFIKVRDYDVCPYSISGATSDASTTRIDIAKSEIQCTEYITPGSIQPAGGGYWLENQRWMLDSAGEWYFEKATYKLYFKPVSGAPASTLRASAKMVGATGNKYVIDASVMNGADDQVVIKNIKLRDSIADAISLTKYSSGNFNFTLDGLEVVNAGRDAIQIDVGNGASAPNRSAIINGKIINAARNGIISSNVFLDIENNTVDKAGRISMTIRNGVKNTPIGQWGSIVKQNNISNSFSSAIQFDALTQVTQNTVTNSCAGSEDCGAIYTYGPFNPGGQGMMYAEVSQNMVDTVPAVNDGIVPVPGNVHNGGIGIYLDGGASAVTVSGNAVKDASTVGILLNQGGASNVVSGNTVYGSGRVALVFAGADTNPYGLSIRDNLISNNDLVANKARTRLIDHHIKSLVTNIGTDYSPSYVAPIKYEGNRYYSVEPRPFQVTTHTASGQFNEWFGYYGWYHLGDGQPVAGLFSNDGTASVSLDSIRNNLTAYTKISTDFGPPGESGWVQDPNVNFVVAPESNVANCLRNACVSIASASQVTSPTDSPAISTGNFFNVQTTKKYLLIFSAKSTTNTPGEYVFPILREMATGGDGVVRPTQYSVGSIQWSGQYRTPLSQEWKTYVMPLDILMNANQARLEFAVGVKDKVFLDEVHLYEVTEDRDTNTNTVWIKSNPSSANVTATCPPAPQSCSGYTNLRTKTALTSTTPLTPWASSVFVSNATSWQDDDWDGVANKSEAAGCNTPGTGVNVGKVKENGCRPESN